jgi:hypothetical protein
VTNNNENLRFSYVVPKKHRLEGRKQRKLQAALRVEKFHFVKFSPREQAHSPSDTSYRRSGKDKVSYKFQRTIFTLGKKLCFAQFFQGCRGEAWNDEKTFYKGVGVMYLFLGGVPLKYYVIL